MKLHKSWDEVEWAKNLHSRLRWLPPYIYEVIGIVLVILAVVGFVLWILDGDRSGAIAP